MSRELLHELIDRIPDGELLAARRFLEYLASNLAYRTALAAPPDDEPVTSDDAEAIRKAGKHVRAGRTLSHGATRRDRTGDLLITKNIRRLQTFQ
jgi:hypothetical protein